MGEGEGGGGVGGRGEECEGESRGVRDEGKEGRRRVRRGGRAGG